jgi:hypothetical protein
MRSGVSYPSYAADPTYAMVTGTANASYPVANLADLYNIRTVFKTTTAGAIAFTFIFPANRTIQLLALLHHNAAAGATVRYRLFSDNNPDPVGNAAHMIHDSTAVALQTGSNFAQSQPYRLAAATAVRSGRVDLSAMSVPWSIGGLELAGFWEWADVAVPREFGIRSNDVIAQQPFGVDHAMSQFGPRTFRGTRELVDQSENLTTAIDFQLATKTSKPFVWVWDAADSATYARECALVRNQRLNPPQMLEYPSGRQSFDLVEHLR